MGRYNPHHPEGAGPVTPGNEKKEVGDMTYMEQLKREAYASVDERRRELGIATGSPYVPPTGAPITCKVCATPAGAKSPNERARRAKSRCPHCRKLLCGCRVRHAHRIEFLGAKPVSLIRLVRRRPQDHVDSGAMQ